MYVLNCNSEEKSIRLKPKNPRISVRKIFET